MLRIDSNGFLENVTIEALPPILPPRVCPGDEGTLANVEKLFLYGRTVKAG